MIHEIAKEKVYSSIVEVNSEISVCFISIPEFIRKYIPLINISDLKVMGRERILFQLESDLSAFFSRDEFEIINRLKVLKKQVEWMAGRAAIKNLVASMGLASRNSVAVSYEKCGAPFLCKFPELTISISHSGSYAVAGIGKSGAAVAVDIEKIVYYRMKSISGVAFTERELDHLQNAEEKEFYINWTRKEAFVKYVKKGFTEGLKSVEIINGAVIHNGTPVNGISIDSEIIAEEYAFTIIYKRNNQKDNDVSVENS